MTYVSFKSVWHATTEQIGQVVTFTYVKTMPLVLILLGSTSVGVAIALYILRKYDPHV
tara:strand:- start:561 stop:734 length:174 start_codon:yes stop_codon:yes gene_type:complete